MAGKLAAAESRLVILQAEHQRTQTCNQALEASRILSEIFSQWCSYRARAAMQEGACALIVRRHRAGMMAEVLLAWAAGVKYDLIRRRGLEVMAARRRRAYLDDGMEGFLAFSSVMKIRSCEDALALNLGMLNKAEQDAEALRREVEASHREGEEALVSLRVEQEARIAALQGAHEEAMGALTREQHDSITALKKEHEAGVAALHREHEDRVSALTEQYEERMADEARRHGSALLESQEEAVRLCKEYGDNISALEQQHKHALSVAEEATQTQRRAHEKEVMSILEQQAQSIAASQEELARLQMAHDDKLSTLCEEHAAATAAAAARHEHESAAWELRRGAWRDRVVLALTTRVSSRQIASAMYMWRARQNQSRKLHRVVAVLTTRLACWSFVAWASSTRRLRRGEAIVVRVFAKRRLSITGAVVRAWREQCSFERSRHLAVSRLMTRRGRACRREAMGWWATAVVREKQSKVRVQRAFVSLARKYTSAQKETLQAWSAYCLCTRQRNQKLVGLLVRQSARVCGRLWAAWVGHAEWQRRRLRLLHKRLLLTITRRLDRERRWVWEEWFWRTWRRQKAGGCLLRRAVRVVRAVVEVWRASVWQVFVCVLGGYFEVAGGLSWWLSGFKLEERRERGGSGCRVGLRVEVWALAFRDKVYGRA